MISIARPVIGQEAGRCGSIGHSDPLAYPGPPVAAFEEEFAALVGAPHACAVANCTVALHLALQVMAFWTRR